MYDRDREREIVCWWVRIAEKDIDVKEERVVCKRDRGTKRVRVCVREEAERERDGSDVSHPRRFYDFCHICPLCVLFQQKLSQKLFSFSKLMNFSNVMKRSKNKFSFFNFLSTIS